MTKQEAIDTTSRILESQTDHNGHVYVATALVAVFVGLGMLKVSDDDEPIQP